MDILLTKQLIDKIIIICRLISNKINLFRLKALETAFSETISQQGPLVVH